MRFNTATKSYIGNLDKIVEALDKQANASGAAMSTMLLDPALSLIPPAMHSEKHDVVGKMKTALISRLFGAAGMVGGAGIGAAAGMALGGKRKARQIGAGVAGMLIGGTVGKYKGVKAGFEYAEGKKGR
jgi:hypothetical protein